MSLTYYTELIHKATSEQELNEIVTQAADDESISNAEYEFVYKTALEEAKK